MKKIVWFVGLIIGCGAVCASSDDASHSTIQNTPLVITKALPSFFEEMAWCYQNEFELRKKCGKDSDKTQECLREESRRRIKCLPD